MTKRIFRSICLAAFCVFIASVVLFMGVLYDYFSELQRTQLEIQTELAAQGVDHEGLAYFEDLEAQENRITWIDENGNVLYDNKSDSEEMENHLQREEIEEALATGKGESSRYSDTLMEEAIYSAKRLSDGTVIRISARQSSMITLLLGMMKFVVAIFVITLILALILAFRLSKRIVKPLNDINLDDPLSNEGYDEIKPLLNRIYTQQGQIKTQSKELEQKQKEFETVTNGMAEGLILLNGKREILSINPSAAAVFGMDESCVGKYILSLNQNTELKELLLIASDGSYCEKTMSVGEKFYQIYATPIVSQGQLLGTVLLLLETTEKEKAEQMRREFTANVSHELKTPLHTISGCAELMANGMVREEDMNKFAGQIYSEAQRMILLVEDIIKLSHLDEGTTQFQWENVNLYRLAEETIDSLSHIAQSSDIKLVLKGESVMVYGVYQLLQSIIYNLLDNAIKYNSQGGAVTVEVKNEEYGTYLKVSDTGIGILPEHQERIFERFYRVDKSHSKDTGGTGLGLSIVKHAARILNADIKLKSEQWKGTSVTVIFPCK